jgi:3-hydroxybutyryl-CoA dehydrogenase
MAVEIMAVIGAGAMGAGIAQIGLTAGLQVKLYDTNAAALQKARDDILGRIARLVEKKSLPEGSVEDAKARLELAETLEALAPAQVVIEAIIERLDAKQGLFKALEAVVAADAVLATNTSSLSVAAIAMGCKHRERVCGLHFFNPVPLMKLVEVIAAPATNAKTVEIATELSKLIGKVPVSVKDGPGFLVNLQGRAYATEALHIIQEGVTDPATLDRMMRDACGFRMGPFELMDLTGIDINFHATNYIYQGYQHDVRLKTTTLHELMSHAGLYGRKTGQGFFSYSGEKSPSPPPAELPPRAPFTARLAEPGAGFELLKAEYGLLERMLAMVANLGCELAQIGIGTPKDIDLAMKLAQNYPRGPLEWAEHLGPKTVFGILTAIQAITGSDRYRPSLWLRRRALLGRPIHEVG